MRDIRSILEGIVSQGKPVGSGGAAFRSASSSGSSGKHDHGVDVGAHRNQAHELRAREAAADKAEKREKEVEKRNREAEKRQKETMSMAKEEEVKEARKPGRSLMDDPRVKRALMVHNTLQGKPAPKPEDSEKKKEEVKEDKMSSGTEARTKIKNVARMDDADPKSEKSTLGKTGQIKTKIIDEGKPTMSLPNFGLPAGLIAATRQIIEKKDDDKISGNKTQVDLEPETDDKVDEGDSKKHTTPKTAKEKKLAALASPKDKITHKDVLVGRGVVKEEEVEQIDERARPDEHGYSLHKTAHKRQRDQTGGFGEPVAATKITYTVKQHGKKVGEIHKERDTYDPTALYTGHLHGKSIPYNRTSGHGVHALMKDIVGSKWHAKHAPKVAKEEVEQVDETAKGGYGVGWMLKKDPELGAKVKQNVAAHKAKVAAMGKPSAGVSVKKEEVEQVDEVSKATLGSYVKKVAALPPEKVKPSREKGIEMASKKLHKEDVEQVDEVSKATLGSYIKKASDDATKHSYLAAKSGDLSKASKASQRIRGIAKATGKLTKEDFSEEELARLEEIAKKFD